MMLGSNRIKYLIDHYQLVSDFISLEKQLQPASFDLTVKEILRISGTALLSDINVRVLPNHIPVPLNSDGWWELEPGAYIAKFNETINLPRNIAALHTQRSTLARSGTMSAIGMWDPGYCGAGQTLLTVSTSFHLQPNTRICQIMFFKAEEVKEIYQGKYQNER